MIDKIRWIIGKKKPVEWDLTQLKTIELPLIGPVIVSWTTRELYSDEVIEHRVGLYWQGDDQLIQLEAPLYQGQCAPLLISGQPILVSDVSYKVKMLEAFTLPPCRIFSPFVSPSDGMVSFSGTGFAGFRYLVERE